MYLPGRHYIHPKESIIIPNPSATFAKYGFIDTSCQASYCKMMDIIPSTELRNIGLSLSYSRMLFYLDNNGERYIRERFMMYYYVSNIK